MQFIDEVTVEVRAGDGGDGCVAFRRERYRPCGGPSGGDGGDGGDVVLEAAANVRTLLQLSLTPRLEAPRGRHGRGNDCFGRGAEPLVVRVPVGTVATDLATGETLADLRRPGGRAVLARGGRGGRGNLSFATPGNRSPHKAEPGAAGEERRVRLELKVLADVGLLGFPNVGKSTLIRAVSRARPKVAPYPFTTLTPQVGVVTLGPERTFVMADIPGLIPGAARGAGLGFRFLRHVERTGVLLHLVTLDPTPGRKPLADHDALNAELRQYSATLAAKPQLAVLTKLDLPDVRKALPRLERSLARRGVELHAISAATGEGVRELLLRVEALLREARAADPGYLEDDDVPSSDNPPSGA
ncbi:MAG: GTPase ObgE [Deltaproteobacteria bacterium]|nr:GTPase ObgE [Deltaproteobacteria bacterium]